MRKILIVSYFYPPLPGMGALRVSKFVKYLPEFGYQPLVIAGGNYRDRIPHQVFRPIIPDPGPIYKLLRGRYRQFAWQRSGPPANNRPPSPPKPLGWWPLSSVRMPDGYLYWVLPAVILGLLILRKYRPEIIFSSSSPPSSAIVAAILQRWSQLPWVAEFRDLWAHNPYDPRIPSIERLNDNLENLVLRRTASLVATVGTVAEHLGKLYGKPTAVIFNGFDESDYPEEVALPDCFTITFTGLIYPGKRDPSRLFQAMQLLQQQDLISPEDFRVRFYGSESRRLVGPIAERYGVSQFCELHGPVPYRESLRRQCESSLLLLVEWDNPQAVVAIPGKVFEYMGAGRPILGVGYPHGPLAQILKETGMGVILRDPEEIARHLQQLLAEWRRGHPLQARKIERPPEVKQFTRRAAAESLARLFDEALDHRSRSE